MPAVGVTKQRLPSGQACSGCRARKNRCDGVRPNCLACQSRGIACEYPSAPAGQLLIELKSFVEEKLRTMAGNGTNGLGMSLGEGRQQLQHSNLQNNTEIMDLEALLEASTNLLSSNSVPRSTQQLGGDQFACSIASKSLETGDHGNSSRASTPESRGPDGYFGDSSTFAFVSKVRSEPPNDEYYRQGHKRQRISRPTKVRQRVEGLGFGINSKDQGACFALPEGELADLLVDAYFKHVHTLYPFVHEPSFRAEYKAIRIGLRDSHMPLRPAWLGLLNLIFAYGCEFCDAVPRDELLSTTTRFVAHAKEIVFPTMFREGTLEMVQALLLMCHYLQGTLELNECWNLVGLMIRTAIGLGIHLQQSSETMTSVEHEISKRVWWGCAVIDRTLSMKYGRPPSIRTADEFTVDLPLNLDDQYITVDLLTPHQPQGRPSKMDFFLQTIKSSNILDRILQDLYQPELQKQLKRLKGNGMTTTLDISHILGATVCLDGKLQSWWQEVPPHLKEASVGVAGPEFQCQINVMRIRYLNLRLLLHRQAFLIFSQQEINEPFQRAVAIASARSCIASARETIRLIYTQYHRRLLNSLWYNLHYVFTSMGVLLTLQTMEKARFELLGQDYEEETLKQGMEFLKEAGSTSVLAARYVAMLQSLRKQPKSSDLSRPMPETGRKTPDIRNGNTLEGLLSNPEGSYWPTRTQYDDEGMEFQSLFGTEFMDYNDLLSGTGLPRDFMDNNWLANGSLI